MFYTIEENQIKEILIEEVEENKPCIAFLDFEQQKEQYRSLGFDELLASENIADMSHFRTSFDVYDDYSIAIINVVSLKKIKNSYDIIALVIKKNRFYVVNIKDDDNSTMEALEGAIRRYRQNATLEKIIFGTLDVLLADGNHNLERYEQYIMDMEKELVSGKISANLNRKIYDMRRQLSVLKNYYQRLVDIGDGLLENTNEIFQEKDLRYIKIFKDKAGRLSNNTQTLGESLIHIREALDATINYSMNKIMKVFTVVSVIFLPLMLITGWYGMNFTTMPEITWRYGYLAVAVLCILVFIVSLLYFKKRKWL